MHKEEKKENDRHFSPRILKGSKKIKVPNSKIFKIVS